jgi:hypothetical protein
MNMIKLIVVGLMFNGVKKYSEWRLLPWIVKNCMKIFGYVSSWWTRIWIVLSIDF